MKLIVFALCLSTYGRVWNPLLTIIPSVLFMHREHKRQGWRTTAAWRGQNEERRIERALKLLDIHFVPQGLGAFTVCLGTPSAVGPTERFEASNEKWTQGVQETRNKQEEK